MKKLFTIASYLVIALLIGVTVSYAGSLTPPGAPSKSMKSLADLYELVNTGTNTPSVDFTTPGAISATMNSIGDVYDLLTTKIADIDGATILTGTTIFGVDGSAIAGTPPTEWAAADVGGILSFNTVNTNCADSTEGGHSDWRLPKLWELSKHYVDGNTNPVLISTAGHLYWTDTLLAISDPNTIASIYMENGGVGTGNKLFGQLHGRCVR